MSRYELKSDPESGVDFLRDLTGSNAFSFLRKGAELFSYRIFDRRRGEPVGLLHRDGDSSIPASGWKNHATILFPVVGRLKNSESRLGEKRIRFKRNHGFARDAVFRLVKHSIEAGAARLVYSISSDKTSRESYPFDFRFDMIYSIDGADLDVTFRVSNPSPHETLYFSCGWHPGFTVTESRFSLNPAGDTFLRLMVGDDNLLTGETREIGLAELERAIAEGPRRALILRLPEKWQRGCRLVDHGRGISIAMAFTDFEFLGVWREPGSGFICVEPWQGTDDLREQTTFDRKIGIVALAPGGTRDLTVKVRPRLI